MARNKADEIQVPDYDDNSNEFADTQAAAASNKTSSGKSSSRSSSGNTGRSSRSKQPKDEPAEEPTEDDEQKRDPFTATLQRGLRRRMNGMVHHAQTVGKPDNVASISDYVNQAISEKLSRDEKRINNGQSFPEPMHMRTGRPQKRR